MSTERVALRATEGGVASVLAVYWIGLLLLIGGLAAATAVIVAAQHHVDAAADLVAVSAAVRLQEGHDACGAAREVAARNGVEVESCEVDGQRVRVEVGTGLALPYGVGGRVRSIAVAGPA